MPAGLWPKSISRGRWFGEEQVNVLRHDDVAEDFEFVVLAQGFEGFESYSLACGVPKQGCRS
jgi:hypothetical protein